MNRMGSKCHDIGTYEINKVSLSCNDKKKYIPQDGHHSYSIFINLLGNHIKMIIL